MKTFNNGLSKRVDFALYGIGVTDGVFVNNFAQPGKTYYLNSYRLAPWRFNLINRVGYYLRPPVHRLAFTGSPSDPYHSYLFRVGGRCFVGGTTPRWAIRLYQHLEYRAAVRATLRGETDHVLCTECGNGLVEDVTGYPGELFDQCRTCHHIHDSHFDRSAIE